MEDNTNDLGMGMFENLDIPNIELNEDDVPQEIKDLLQEEPSDEGNGNDTPPAEDDENIKNPSEDLNGSEEVAKGEEGEDDGGTQDDDSPNNFSSFAAVLSEQGLLPSLDLQNTQIKTAEDLINAFKSEYETKARDYIVSKLGEEGYEALEKGITLQEYQQHTTNSQNLDKITDEVLEEDLELSKNVILQDYINQGISEDRALRLLKKTIDLGEESILEEAKVSLTSLKEMQEIQLQKLAEAREAQQQAEIAKQEKIDNDLKNSIYSTKEIISGLKIDKTIQDKVYKSITEVIGQSPNGVMENRLMTDRRENPVDFDVKLYYIYELTNGFKDFSKIARKTESKAIKDLEDSLRQTNFKNQGGDPTFMSDPNSYGGSEFGSELVL